MDNYHVHSGNTTGGRVGFVVDCMRLETFDLGLWVQSECVHHIITYPEVPTIPVPGKISSLGRREPLCKISTTMPKP